MTQKVETKTENTKYKDGVNRNARLCIRNLPFKATEDDVRDVYKQYGTVEEVKLMKRPDGKSAGCAFVHFTHVPMANKALSETNKKPMMGRPMNVSWAIPKNKYDEQLGKNKRGNTSGILQQNTEEVKENKQQEKESKIRVNKDARLIIRNMSFKATEDSIKEHFAQYGQIIDVNILKKPDGKLVGCAFVQYKNVPMAKNAILNTNMKPFLGRPISVDWAVAKNKYMRHIVEQELQMQEQVKKEDSDDDDDDAPPINISNDDLKVEVKSESDDDSEADSEEDDKSDDGSVKSEDDSDGEEDAEEEEEVDEEDDDDDVDMNEEDEVESTTAERKRIKLNDAEDGCTLFVSNLSFEIDDDRLKAFAEQTGPVKYALVCVDKLTEHSKGTAFVKFTNKEDADKFLSLEAHERKLDGQVCHIKPALTKEHLPSGDKKQPKDNRNLYLVKEGVVVAGTKAAVGVSSSDMTKRLALEKSKTQMLKNLNRFVSRYRLVVSNLPAHYDDRKLRTVCVNAAPRGAIITEARVMRDLRAAPGRDGKQPSKGYGFVMFMKHEDALTCLRKLNNNPDVFDKNNRPIVSFSIEDRTALNARKKRLEKSIANNPTNKNNPKNNNIKDNQHRDNRLNRKRKNQTPDESNSKKGRFNKRNQDRPNDNSSGNFVKNHRQDDVKDYAGLTAKEGAQHKMRSHMKLKTQADVHRQNVKMEKKTSKRAQKLKMAAKERVKQPKQKINKQPKKVDYERKVTAAIKESAKFSDLVSKYKTKLSGNSLDRVKAKWYDS